MASAMQLLKTAVKAIGTSDDPLLQTPETFDPSTLDPAKIAAGLTFGAGQDSALPIEEEFRALGPAAFVRKHGPDALAAVEAIGSNVGDLYRDSQLASNDGSVFDFPLAVGKGLVQGAGGLAALAGAVNDYTIGLGQTHTGTTIAKATQAITDFLSKGQSEGAHAGQRQYAAKSAVMGQDSKAKHADDPLARIGEDVINATINTFKTPGALSELAGEAVGSLAVGGPVTKAVKGLAAPVVNKLAQRIAARATTEFALPGAGVASGALESATRRAITDLSHTVDKVTWPSVIGAMESGGAYSQQANEVLNTDFAELEKTSSYFRELLKTHTPEEAREITASRSGMLAAIVDLPGAIAAGTMTRFLEAPFHVPSLKQAAKNVLLKEPIEEAIQNTSQQLSQNLATKKYVDPAQDMLAGVGEQLAQGAIGGALGAGALQSPGIAVRAVVGGAKGAGSVVTNRAQKIRDTLNEASPVAPEQAQQDFEATVGNTPEAHQQAQDSLKQAINDAPVNTAEEQAAKQQAEDFVAQLQDIHNPDTSPEALAGFPESIQTLLSGSKNRLDALDQVAKATTAAFKAGDTQQANLLAGLHQGMLDPIRGLQQKAPTVFENLPEDSPARKVYEAYGRYIANLDNTPAARQANTAFEKSVQQTGMDTLPEITEANVDSPESRAVANTAVAMASVAPEKGDSAKIATILKHATKLGLSEGQQGVLKASLALTKAHKAMLNLLQNPDTSKRTRDVISNDVVSGDLKNSKTAKGNSAKDFVRELSGALRAGNTEGAKNILADFELFVRHMQNKLTALNTHFAKGDPHAPPEDYQQLIPKTRSWLNALSNPNSKFPGAVVNTKSTVSIAHAQAVGNESQILTQIYNDLVKAFPKLGGEAKREVSLDPALLQGTPEQTKQALEKGPGAVPTKTTKAAKPKGKSQQAESSAAGSDVEAKPTFRVSIVVATKAGQIPTEIEYFDDGSMVLHPSMEGMSSIPVDAKTSKTHEIEDILQDKFSRWGYLGHAVGAESSKPSPNSPPKITGKPAPKGAPVEDTVPLAPTKTGDINRRKNKAERKRIDQLTPEELRQELLTSEVTGLPNQRAFNEDESLGWKTVGAADMDGLKRLNTYLGHEGADIILAALGEILQGFQSDSVRFYHRSGDEIAARFKNKGEAESVMQKVQAVLDQTEIHFEVDGTPYMLSGIGISFGLGDTYANADEQATRNKQQRLEAGQRQDPSQPGSPVRLHQVAQGQGQQGVGDGTEAAGQLTPQARTLSSLLPNLVNQAGNMFLRGFSLRTLKGTDKADQTSPTKLWEQATPVQFAKDALKSDEAFQGEKDSTNLRSLTDDAANAYQALFKHLAAVGNHMNQALKNAPEKIQAKFRNGRVLSLAEEVDGVRQYNPQLLGGALLAGMQWLLTMADNSDLGSLDPESGIEDNPGQSATDIAQSMGEKILEYWGVSANADAFVGQTQGIVDAMVGEVVEAMLQEGLLNEGTVKTKDGHDLKVYTSNVSDKAMPIDNLSAIDQVMLRHPVDVFHLGESVPKTQPNQLHSQVKNTHSQKKSATKVNEVPLHLDMTMADAMASVPDNVLLDVFGNGDLRNKPLNKNDRVSKEGKNLQVLHAQSYFKQLLAAMKNQVADTKNSIKDLAIHYGNNYSAVGRLQMQGRFTPQSDKHLRELVLPTHATLDVTKSSKQLETFKLAMAQALGLKIELDTPYMMGVRAVEALESKQALAPAVELVREWLGDRSQPFPLAQVKEAFDQADPSFKLKFSNVAVHAVMDFARMQKTHGKARRKFETSLYIEADGKTNGLINALMNLTLGKFTPGWISAVRKGGVVFGARTPLHTLDAAGKVDLYQEVAAKMRNYLHQQIRETQRQSDGDQVSQVMRDTMEFLAMFDENITVNPNGEFDIGRPFTKNPSTTFVYGIGESSTASKILTGVQEKLYEMMSRQAVLGEDATYEDIAKAGFPDAVDPVFQLERFQSLFETLTQNTLAQYHSGKRKGEFYLQEQSVPAHIINPATFTLSQAELDALRQNLQMTVAKPLRAAAQSVVGRGVLDGMELVQQTTQLQSLVAAQAFRDVVETKLTEYKQQAAEGKIEWSPSDFLTQKDLDQIWLDLKDVFPFVQTGFQNFLVTKQANWKSGYSVGTSLSEKFKPQSRVWTPADAGVAGIPYLNIGLGDGYMIQLYAQDPTMSGNLMVFDGIHMPLDRALEQNPKINEAVANTWKQNPFRAIQGMFTRFNTEATQKALGEMVAKEATKLQAYLDTKPSRIDDTQVKEIAPILAALTRASGLDIESVVEGAPAFVLAYLGGLQNQVETSAREGDARRIAIQKTAAEFGMSADQMAALAQPYTEGNLGDSELDPQTLLETLNRHFNEAMAASEPKVEQAKPTQQTEAETKVESAAREIKFSSKNTLWKHLSKLPGVADTKIMAGTLAQLTAYTEAHGLQAPPVQDGQDLHAWIQVGDQPHIFMVTDGTQSPEQLQESGLHEAIHAATYAQVLAYYQGNLDSDTAKTAVSSLETLQNKFIDLDASNLDEATQSAVLNAKLAIREALMDGSISEVERKAKGLNEFMAWGLSNPALKIQLTKTKVSDQFFRIAKAVMTRVKALIFGNGEVPALHKNVFSQLQFHSLVLAHETVPGLTEMLSDNLLKHATKVDSDPRIQRINKAMLTQLTQGLDDWNFQRDGKLALDELVAKHNFDKEKIAAIQFATNLEGEATSVFNLSPEAASTFKLITAAMAAQVELDPAALLAYQQLYAHALEHLKVDHLVRPERDDIRLEETLATSKLGFLTGTRMGKQVRDKHGSTALLSAFMALATVDPDLRAALAKLPTPKLDKRARATKQGAHVGFEGAVSHEVAKGMQWMGQTLSGQRAKGEAPRNMQQAVDLLNAKITKQILEDKSWLEHADLKTNGLVDKLDTKASQLLGQLGQGAVKAGKQIVTGSKTKFGKTAGHILSGTGALLNEDAGSMLSQEAVRAADANEKLPRMLRDLMGSITGRLPDNANLYDLIKKTKDVVSRGRQQFREDLPRTIAEHFNRVLSKQEWHALHQGLAQADIAALVETGLAGNVVKMLHDRALVKQQASQIEGELETTLGKHAKPMLDKARQLAHYMITKDAGTYLLKNAQSIGDNTIKGFKASESAVQALDRLVSLYALEELPKATRERVEGLAKEQPEGVQFALDYLVQLRQNESAKLASLGPDSDARYNAYKGHSSIQTQPGSAMIVADDAQYARLIGQGFTRVGDYQGSSLDPDRFTKRGYYFTQHSASVALSQGLFQTVRPTVNGAEQNSGFTQGQPLAGMITDHRAIRAIQDRLKSGIQERAKNQENLVPVLNSKGMLVGYEKSMNPAMLAKVQGEQNLAQSMGAWRGRQVEESLAPGMNTELVDRLHEDWNNATPEQRKKGFVDVLNEKQLKDVVDLKAASLLQADTIRYAGELFGEDAQGKPRLMVRRSQLTQVLGYHQASVSDFWTGNTRWNDEIQAGMQDILTSMFGKKAYAHLVRAEQTIQGGVAWARRAIIVSSIIVPTLNATANVFQLMARGVPRGMILKGIPKYVNELEHYVKTQSRQIELEAEIFAETNPLRKARLQAEIDSIKDSHARLSIAPLLEAGEFGTIADIGMSSVDLQLNVRDLSSWVESKIDQLPQSAQLLARYGTMSTNTGLFQVLQKSVQYGDLVAKAVLFEHLTKNQKVSQKEALGHVTEAFVNYDYLAGRGQNYLENIGLAWFWNYKLRIMKEALYILRHHPFHALITANMPMPTGIDLPWGDSLLGKVWKGTYGYSLGPAMGLESVGKLPIAQIGGHLF